MKIAKDAIPRWARINDIKSEIISAETNKLLEIQPRFDIDIDEYINDIKEKYVLSLNVLSFTVIFLQNLRGQSFR